MVYRLTAIRAKGRKFGSVPLPRRGRDWVEGASTSCTAFITRGGAGGGVIVSYVRRTRMRSFFIEISGLSPTPNCGFRLRPGRNDANSKRSSVSFGTVRTPLPLDKPAHAHAALRRHARHTVRTVLRLPSSAPRSSSRLRFAHARLRSLQYNPKYAPAALARLAHSFSTPSAVIAFHQSRHNFAALSSVHSKTQIPNHTGIAARESGNPHPVTSQRSLYCTYCLATARYEHYTLLHRTRATLGTMLASNARHTALHDP